MVTEGSALRQIVRQDRQRHRPGPGAKANWQESFYLGWADLHQGLAGAHHISLAPGGSSHVWSWLLADGKVVARSQQHDLPLPTDDLENMRLGSLTVVAGDSLRALDLGASFDNARADLSFRAICDPVEVNLNQDDTILAERHYEAMGPVRGAVRIGDRTFEVDGAGWHDHSWGAREFKSNPSHRWLFAVFGDDLAFSVFSFVTGARRASFGWVCDRGEILTVRRVAFHAIVNDDGMTPEGCDAEVFTEGGRGYHVRGVCQAHALMGGKGWFGVDGVTRFECAGRIGQGFLEVAELKTMTAEMAAELGV
jgi:hypothetical protein